MITNLIPDEPGERMAPLLPKRPARRHHHPGRLPVPDRVALAGTVHVLRTGVAWRDVPSRSMGRSGVAAWRRLREGTGAGLRPRLHAALLTGLRAADLSDMDDRAIDGSHLRALTRGLRPGPRRWTVAAPAPGTM